MTTQTAQPAPSRDVAKSAITDPTPTDADKDRSLTLARHEAEVGRLKLQNKTLEQDHEDRKADREMRFKYSRWVYAYLVAYSVFVGGLLILHGFAAIPFALDDVVLTSLVGSTAVSAIGLVLAVTTGLFNSRRKKED